MGKLEIYVSEESYLLKDHCGTNDKAYVCVLFPENDKHPKMQATFMRQLIAHYVDNGKTLAVYTNSNTIINVVGDAIAEGKKELCSNTEIFVLSKDDETIISTFDANGFLDNWPLGFFTW